MKRFIDLFILVLLCFAYLPASAENGYDLWLRYRPVEKKSLRNHYASRFSKVYVQDDLGATGDAIKDELDRALYSMIGKNPEYVAEKKDAKLIISSGDSGEGFLIKSKPGTQVTEIIGEGPVGALYATYALLHEMQMGKLLDNLDIERRPEINRRVLNHWDNLNGTIERGYAGL